MTVAGVLLLGLVLHAAPPVAVVCSEPEAPVTRRTVAELGALGYVPEVVVWGGEPLGPDRVRGLAEGRTQERLGVVSLLDRQAGLAAWVVDVRTGMLRSRELTALESRSPEVAAVKLAETIRALFLELPVPPPAPPPPVPPEPPEPLAPPWLWLALHGGASGSRGTAFATLGASVRARIHDRVALEATGGGALLPAKVTGEEGVAALSAQRVALGARFHLLAPDSTLQAGLGLALYGERFEVTGEAVAPWRGSSEVQWTGGLELGLQGGLKLHRRLRLSLEVGAGASPRTFAVAFGERVVARWGWFSWSARLGLEVGVWP